MQIFDNSLQLDGKCEIIVFIRQQVIEKISISHWIYKLLFWWFFPFYGDNPFHFMTTEKHEREKKTERLSYFLIMLRTKMQICMQVGGKFSEELEKEIFVKNWQKHFWNNLRTLVTGLLERFLCVKPLFSCGFVNLLPFWSSFTCRLLN